MHPQDSEDDSGQTQHKNNRAAASRNARRRDKQRQETTRRHNLIHRILPFHQSEGFHLKGTGASCARQKKALETGLV